MTKKTKGKRTPRETQSVVKDIPIPNLPDQFLWMHVNSGTKIRNVLNYALKELPGYKSVVWSGAGQGIGKVITCAELCKKKNPGLHQVTKLRYIKSKKSAEVGKDSEENRSVPEIHILLSKDVLDSGKPGHQSPDDNRGLFLTRRSEEMKLVSSDKNSEYQASINPKINQQNNSMKLSNVATEEFAAMGLRTGQKRSHKGLNKTETASSGNKSRKKGKSD